MYLYLYLCVVGTIVLSLPAQRPQNKTEGKKECGVARTCCRKQRRKYNKLRQINKRTGSTDKIETQKNVGGQIKKRKKSLLFPTVFALLFSLLWLRELLFSVLFYYDLC